MGKRPSEITGFWGGCYTADANGNGSGITDVTVSSVGIPTEAAVAVETDSPSFVASHPSKPVVYAACEMAEVVRAFSVVDGRLEPLGEAVEAGYAVCHVAVDPAGKFLVATCYGDGRVLTYELGKNGAIIGKTVAPAATDPYRSKGEERPTRAHSSLILQSGRVLTTDLGYDIVRVWQYKKGKGLVHDHDVTLPKGSGPRHMAVHPSGNVFVVTEHSCEVVVLSPHNSGRFQVASVTPAMQDGAAKGDAAANITVDDEGRYVHVSVRGCNRIAVLAVRNAGMRLEPVADVDCGGNWPRFHLLAGDLLHVTNQLSDTVTTFRVDGEGVPAELIHTLDTPSPTCLAVR